MKPDNSVPQLVVKKDVDQSTGEAKIDYYWEGTLATKVQITGPLVDRMSGLTLIEKDLSNAHKWMKLAEKLVGSTSVPTGGGYFRAADRDTFDTVKAYFVAALTFYGKCFTEAEGRHANASRDWIETKYRDLHDYYMDYRHNFAAHSGDKALELARSFVVIKPDGTALVPHLPTIRLQPDVAFSSPGELGFTDLIEHVANSVAAKYQKVARKLIDEFIIPAGVEFWTQAAEKGQPVTFQPSKKPGA